MIQIKYKKLSIKLLLKDFLPNMLNVKYNYIYL